MPRLTLVASARSCFSSPSTPTHSRRRLIERNRVPHLLFLCLLCLAVAIAAPAQTFTTLTVFDNTTNSAQPNGPLVQGLDGNLYGTTVGQNTGSGGGFQDRGTVFKIIPTGTLTTIYSFCSQALCADGGNPLAGLLLGTDGNFYGTTSFGTNRKNGAIFKITPEGELTVLYRLCLRSACGDGIKVLSPLIQATDGNLYGAASTGGFAGHFPGCGAGCGTIFKLNPSGTLKVLHTFCATDCADGAAPNGLIQASDGNLYGTTTSGGIGGGTVFSMTTTGTLTTLSDFCNPSCAGIYAPEAGLIQASDGDLYGTTALGGPSSIPGSGGVFKISLTGALTTIYDFCTQPNCPDGASPRDVLIQGTDGNFYGTTVGGGTANGGTLFKLTSSGTLTVLHNFPNWRHGSPGVMQATNGNFYGTAQDNAQNHYGILFREATGLGPFVKTLPTSGKVGAKVTILGSNLTGTTAVEFNGVPATFTVVSGTEITTTLPTGATTGTVTVTAGAKTLSSNMAFQVR
jgi:uncharacterized repeat protein (TIGR03803 family)